MCNCRKEINGKIKNALGVDNGSIDFDLLNGFTSSAFIYRDKKGKSKTQYVYHTNCPFCGVSYEPKPDTTDEPKSRFAVFTEDEVYMLSRQAIHGSFDITMGDEYSEEEKKMHENLINEIVAERKRRGI